MDKKALKEVNSKEGRLTTKLVIDEMNKVDPAFFDELEANVYSSDLEGTHEALVKSTGVLEKALDNLGASTSDPGDISTNCLAAAVATLALALGVQVAIVGLNVAALESAAWVHNKVYFYSSIIEEGNTSTEQELMTLSLIESALKYN
ncbi:hypothetical protein [Rummeliibacillus sp. SL167]|uniref:hypothetical protein n=1 Tax=Rummeliibacillus sp. SL167 TaxID=2579792 RepID=UPI0011B833C7|nr:hypothetical protein [Rummeliibacillus sp. SL167]